MTSGTSPIGHSGAPILANQAKYFDLLARYYVSKRQHLLAAHILLRLAERRSTDAGDAPTLEQRLKTSLAFFSWVLPEAYGFKMPISGLFVFLKYREFM